MYAQEFFGEVPNGLRANRPPTRPIPGLGVTRRFHNTYQSRNRIHNNLVIAAIGASLAFLRASQHYASYTRSGKNEWNDIIIGYRLPEQCWLVCS